MITTEELDDDDGYGEDEYEINKSPFKRDIRIQAIECMDAFFVDKKYWAGGGVPVSKLFSEKSIITVMQTTVNDALDVAHECLECQCPQSYDTKESDWQVKLCYSVLGECSRRFVPKCFAGGILLVYLALCQGVDYIEPLKRYNPQLHDMLNAI